MLFVLRRKASHLEKQRVGHRGCAFSGARLLHGSPSGTLLQEIDREKKTKKWLSRFGC